MKHWKEISKEYSNYLINIQKLKVPRLRISQLKKIEVFLQNKYPQLLNGETNFTEIDKDELKESYHAFKKKDLTDAEDQIFNDFYKLAVM